MNDTGTIGKNRGRATVLKPQKRPTQLAGLAFTALILLTGNVTAGQVVIPVGAILVLVWVRWSKTPWRDIGYSRPKSWMATIGGGILIGCALKFLMKSIVMPLLLAEPVNRSYHYLAGNDALLPYAVWAMLVAGFAEETVFRGFLFERLGKMLKNRTGSAAMIVALTSVLFGLAHYRSQGWAGVEQATITGLVFGTIYSFTKKIGLPMIAHAAFDLTALAFIYWDAEARIAHLFFQ